MSKRARASTPRTRTGCANCRQRRIKCDEAEPGCERCRRSGWTCGGYSQADRSEIADINGVASARRQYSTFGIGTYSLPFKVPGSQEERRALHYFSNFAAADLTGYMPSSFWSRTVLQRCQHDVPVRHAAAALGRVHLEYTTADGVFTASEESVEAYRKSVKALRNYLGRQSAPDRAMVLICSSIFFSFELVRGDRRAAQRHLRSGLEILNEWQSHDSVDTTALDSRDELVAVFGRLDLQATMFDDGRVPVLQVDHHEHEACSALDESAQLAFNTLEEVQQCLFPLLHNAFSFLVRNVAYKFADVRTVPEAIIAQRKRLLQRCDHWERRAQLIEHHRRSQLKASSDCGTSDHERALSAAKLHHRTIKLLLQHCLQDDVTRYAPSFDDEADQLLKLATNVVFMKGPLSGSQCSKASPRRFYLHLGVVAPMFLLAMKSNDTNVVQAAIKMLRSASGRREGYYDADQMAQVAESLIRLQGQCKAEDQNVSTEEPARASTPSLEWMADEVMEYRVPYHWHDEEGRWKGYDRLLALVA